jgi:hypothetical protein
MLLLLLKLKKLLLRMRFTVSLATIKLSCFPNENTMTTRDLFQEARIYLKGLGTSTWLSEMKVFY